MKSTFKKALIALFALVTMGSLTACSVTDKLMDLLSFGSSSASTESEAEPNESEGPKEESEEESSSATECEHTYADEYTCHNRVCTECGETLAATTEHTFGEWVTIRYPDCENGGMEKKECVCGEEEQRSTQALGHTYADEITCHDRTCTVEDCGYIEPASTPHNYGEWETITDATCLQNGEDSRTCEDCGGVNTKVTTKDHEFDEDGVCPMCEKGVKDLFITVAGVENNTDAEIVTADNIFGRYEITTTGENDNDAYAMIPGSVLTALKDLGYTTLTFTVINPAPGLADMNDKCKSFFLSADAPANLWSADTAIAYWAWQNFWDAGKKVTFTVDLETYAGHNLYIYTQQCATYPTVIQIAEFIEYENPVTYVYGNGNCNVEYIEGMGWQFVAIDPTSTGGQYAYISTSVAQYYKAQGKNLVKISFVNSFGLEGSGNEGNPVNTQIAVLPEKVEGGNDWYFCNGFVSQVGTKDEASDSYYVLVNLEDERYDFTKDIELYFKYCDVANNVVATMYISAIEFIEHSECTYDWVLTKETDCKEVGYETGTCSVCKAVATRDLEEELLPHNHEWSVTTPANCVEQGIETGICSVCGDTQTRPTVGELLDHYYEWTVTTPGTCQVKAIETGVCTGCEGTQTREGEYGDHNVEWSIVSDATCVVKATEAGDCEYCGETQTREVGELAACIYDGLNCTVCGNSIAKDLMIPEEATDSVSATLAKGFWSLTSTDSNNYTIMQGSVLQQLYDAGYTKLTLTVVNPAPGGADVAEKCKTCYIAADSHNNLWSADTAIAFYGWQAFWNNGKKFTVEIDLATYAGRDIYIYSDHCDVYATEIVIKELIDYSNPVAYFAAGSNCTVEYIEGKGWQFAAIDSTSTSGQYATLSADLLQYQKSQGKNLVKISFVNSFGLENSGNEGNPINTQIAVLPEKVEGGNDWYFCNGFVSQVGTKDEASDSYYVLVNLEDERYDFTKDIELYFSYRDVAGKVVATTYISSIEFIEHKDCTYDWVLTKATDCVAVGYETGTCSVCKATTTRDLEEELLPHNHVWTVTTPANCVEQGIETGICSVCGDTQTRPTTEELTGHYYEWVETTSGTCQAKAIETGTCTGCGDTQTREGEYGDHNVDWSIVSDATCEVKAMEAGACEYCGEEFSREVGELAAHNYVDAKCSVCGDSIARKLIVNEEAADISVSLATGTWTISSTGSNAYAKMPGDVLKALFDAGYTKLTLTVVNPAPGGADAAEKCKTCYIAADARGNLWSADTAIAFYGWQAFWNNGKKFTVEIDLATYAGRDIYIFSDHNDVYPTQITISEMIDLEDPAARLVGLASDNGAVEYIEGKGWHAYSINGSGAYYVRINGDVVMHYINKGYTSLKLSVVNNLNIGITTAGNSVNVQQAVLLKNSAGSNDWNYCNGWLSAKWTSENGGYTHTIDLTNAAYDFSKGVTLYFTYTDVAGSAVGHTYFTGIDFLK